MAFQQGLSGLNAASKNLEIIGNNVANAQTFGAKASRAEFSDVYAAALNGAGASAVGIGVNLAAVAQQFTQGNITTTENPLDLAINGSGFFQLTDTIGSPPLYSRNGQFKIDKEGYVVNNQGLRLMGVGDAAIRLPTGPSPAKVTDRIEMEFNLDSREQPIPDTLAFDPADVKTYHSATSVTVYDTLGNPIALTAYFRKTDPHQWQIHLRAPGGATVSPSPIELEFDPDTGAITDGAMSTLTITPVTELGTGAFAVPFDLKGSTQFGAGFGVTKMWQSGFTMGQLTGVVVQADGELIGRFSNGQSQTVGRIELATFRNPNGLQPLGGNVWAATFAAGTPTRSMPGQGNMGVLQSGALEESNVDLTAELVAMITAQRIYQANAQTIKTTDQAMQTIVNLR